MSTQPLNTPAIEARLAAANKELIHICKDPAKNFVMRVPVKDYDSDRVLSAALDDTQALLDEVARLRELVAQCVEAMEQTYEVSDYPANGKSPCDRAIKAARARLQGDAP